MADYLPRYTPGAAITCTASGNVTGGRLVTALGDYQVKNAAPFDTHILGVASVDSAAGETLAVFSGGVQALTVAGAAVAAGKPVYLAADGCVSASGDFPVGIALTGGAAGAQIDVNMGAILAPAEAPAAPAEGD